MKRIQNAFEITLKIELKVKWNANFGQIKDGSWSELFSAPVDAQGSTNEEMINVLEVRLIIQYMVTLYYSWNCT